MSIYSNYYSGNQGSLYYNGSCYGSTSPCPAYGTSKTNIYAAAYLLQGGPGAICPYVRLTEHVTNAPCTDRTSAR